MARPPSRYPTELELEILKIFWQQGPRTGRQVRDALAGRRDLAYTSVMTMLKIMTGKGFLRRKKTAGGFVFHPRVEHQAVARTMLGDIVARVFDGSTEAVMLSLLDQADVDREELGKLRELIDRRAKEEPK